MNRLVSAAALAAALVFPQAARAAGVPTLPLASPPVGANPASSMIFDAMIAIGRAAGSNPSAAQSASFPYAAAIQQYNAGDFDRARASAVQAIAQSNAPHYPEPTNPPPNVSPAAAARMPDVTSVPQAEMEERLALGRRALTTCGPTTSTQFATARSVYDSAVQDTLHQHLDAVNREVQSIVDTCATVTPS